MVSQLVNEAIGNLLASRQRSALALLGILIGAGAVIAMLDIGAMAQNETVKQFQQLGTDVLEIVTTDVAGFRSGDAADLIASVHGLSAVAPLMTGNGLVMQSDIATRATLAGVTGDFLSVAKLHVASGRFISDFDGFELFAVLGSDIAASLDRFDKPLQLNDDVRVGRYVFRVIGILAPVARNPILRIDSNKTVFMSIVNSKRASNSANLNTILGRVAAGASADGVALQIRSYFENQHHGMYLLVTTAEALIASMAQQQALFQILLGAVAAISLTLGGVGVMNIMLISVQERRREIGIRLALGARGVDIQLLFLIEAVVLALVGASLGFGVGLLGSLAFARLSQWEFLVSPWAGPLGAGVSVAVGIFFGFYPAFMASRMDPILALRSE